MSFPHTGAYKGVPFKISHDEFVPWDNVDPGCQEGGIFLCFSAGRTGARHVNYPQTHVERSLDKLEELCAVRCTTMAKNLNIVLTAEELEERLADGETREDIAAGMFGEIMGENNADYHGLKNLLTMAEIPFSNDKFSGDDQNEVCWAIFVQEDGREFTDEDKRIYNIMKIDINNWLWGNCYEVETPLENFGGFTDDGYPEIHKKCGAALTIKDEINKLFAQKSGEYLVLADYATTDPNAPDGVSYNPAKKLKIYVDSEEEAKKISGFFNGHALAQKTKDLAR